MQGTVAEFHPDGSGTVLLDDGTRLPFDGHAFSASGLQRLRSGQRVRLRLSPDAQRVTALTIATLPWGPGQPDDSGRSGPRTPP